MIKPADLRARLTAAIPDLVQNPDKLLVFIDAGSIVGTFAPGQSFEYRYTLNLILTDFAGHPDAAMVPLMAWLRTQQPELLANPALRDQISFEADVLSNDLVDLSIKIPLTERVGVHPRAAGGYDVEHYPEPIFDDTLPAAHWELYLKGELIATWDPPPA